MGITPRAGRRAEWAIAAGAVCGATVLLVWRLPAPFGGYHGWNEGWYAGLGRAVAEGNLLPRLPMGGIPLGFAWILGAAFRVAGAQEVVARLVCAAAFVGVGWQTVRLARASAASTPIALALAASSPMLVIVAQNVQTDLVYLWLGYWWWNMVVGRGDAPVRYPGGAAVLAAAGWLVKPFVLLFWCTAAVTATLRARSLGWLRSRRLWRGCAVTGACLAPYYVAQSLWHAGEGTASYRYAVLGHWGFPAPTMLAALGLELFWGLGPGVLVAAGAGSVWLWRRRHPARDTVVLLLVTLTLTFAMLHRHTYYAVFLVPAAVVAAAHGLERCRPALRLLLVGLVVVSGLAYSGLVLLTKEAGQAAYARVGQWIHAEAPGGAVILLSDRLANTYGPVVLWYATGSDTVTSRDALRAAGTQRPVYRVEAPNAPAPAGPSYVATRDRWLVRLGSRTYMLDPGNEHVFRPPRLRPAPRPLEEDRRVGRVRIPWVRARLVQAARVEAPG